MACSTRAPSTWPDLTAEGYGAIEFLDAQGKVIHTLAPEAELRR
jgi:hypothetical protein